MTRTGSRVVGTSSLELPAHDLSWRPGPRTVWSQGGQQAWPQEGLAQHCLAPGDQQTRCVVQCLEPAQDRAPFKSTSGELPCALSGMCVPLHLQSPAYPRALPTYFCGEGG